MLVETQLLTATQTMAETTTVETTTVETTMAEATTAEATTVETTITHLPHALEEALVVVHTHQVAMVVQISLAQVDLRQSAQQVLTMELLGFSTARVGGSRTLMVHTL